MSRQIFLRISASWLWAWVTMTAFASTVSATAQIVRWIYPETEATSRCEEIDKGTIGMVVQNGIICVHPVHFIERP